jgi:hypothetical protein
MPSDAELGRCDWCGAKILWTVTAATGSRMAMDPEPNEQGNQAVHKNVTGAYVSRGISKDRPTVEAAEWLAVPHVATCKAPRPRVPRRQGPRTVRRPPWRPR